MPHNVMTPFPCALNSLEAMKVPLRAGETMLEAGIQSLSLGLGMIDGACDMGFKLTQNVSGVPGAVFLNPFSRMTLIQQQGAKSVYDIFKDLLLGTLKQMHREKRGELAFMELFTEQRPEQDWSVAYDDTHVLLDLPGMRVIDISTKEDHLVRNYTVVFAPRAGHHSNVAERVALWLRSQGLTRMAVVEQKCADDIPLYVDKKRHSEDFEGQVRQYGQVLSHLSDLTGHPSHLVAVCQPGPMLITTLILNPHLARTFGSAGSPMHTEAEKGFLTDFSRQMGEEHIDRMIALFGRTVKARYPGSGRQCYDGSLQVLGFYYLGMDQHLRNFKHLLTDLREGNDASADRQVAFYNWYNTVHHFPADFIRDTYKKIFVKNELIRGNLTIGDRTIGIGDYPASVPIWALGGMNDNIAPPLQATGHMELIDSVPPENKLNLICDGGHMGLFRSRKIFKSHYARIAKFILTHSDRAS